ncbi:MAG: hypothetical protein AB8B56_11170 [Crocinitomicaceae bacterium]
MAGALVSFAASLFPLIAAAAAIGIIIYLIIQRVNEKESETFEDRNN